MKAKRFMVFACIVFVIVSLITLGLDSSVFKQHGYDITRASDTVVAIGCAITFKSKNNRTNIQDAPFFKYFLPSFCKTASPGYSYTFYLAYDQDDQFLGQKWSGPDSPTDLFARRFWNTTCLCVKTGVHRVSLKVVKCGHSGHPAWAQSDAMMEAHYDGADFYYRINDDTVLITPGWTKAFIDTLLSYKPPLVGVVGPSHIGGNVNILTYDFVHRTHIDIFGYYYPSVFTDWFADSWMTRVYLPGRSAKLTNVRVDHKITLGTRYTVNMAVLELRDLQMHRDRITLQRYLTTIA